MTDKIYIRNRWRLPKIFPKHTKKNYSYSKILKIGTILIVAFTFAFFSLQAVEPIIEVQCKTMAKSVATKISNNEATKVMQHYGYDDLLNTTKDENGNVKMVETNMITVNEIISAIPNAIQDEMGKTQNNTFTIRLGSFFGSNLFAGRGPNVTIKMELVGSIDTNLKSEFISAGINQTLHKIYLEIECHTLILTPYHTIEENIKNQVLLAEGVIVGEVPSTYYHLEGINAGDTMEVMP